MYFRKGAALRVARRARPLTNPHPRDASGASLAARVKFKLRTASALYFLLRLTSYEISAKSHATNSTAKFYVKSTRALANLGEGVDEMSEFCIIRIRV
nr:hypothetical protein [uncultured Campylobacter sp.]